MKRRWFQPVLALPVLAALCHAVLPTAAAAQSMQLGQGSDEPMEIEASEGLEWHQEQKLYVARGDAVFRQGSLTVSAEVLTAYYRDGADGSTEIYRMAADGAVVIADGEDRATGAQAVYDLDRSVFVLKGGDLALHTGDDVITARDSLEYWQDRQIAVARGNAKATRGSDVLEADVLTGQFAEGEDGELELTVVNAIGSVRVTTETDVATGDEAVYDLKARIATLSGNVRLTRGANQLNGDVAEVNLATGVSRLLSRPGGGRVRGLLVPGSEGGLVTEPGPGGDGQ